MNKHKKGVYEAIVEKYPAKYDPEQVVTQDELLPEEEPINLDKMFDPGEAPVGEELKEEEEDPGYQKNKFTYNLQGQDASKRIGMEIPEYEPEPVKDVIAPSPPVKEPAPAEEPPPNGRHPPETIDAVIEKEKKKGKGKPRKKKTGRKGKDKQIRIDIEDKR
ncbi:hypothetical protein GF351_04265 [Candidatus Woesearchaeota archaeon]|nr:hypothetical protein [Candidatus Woesearchaeota archaeon]